MKCPHWFKQIADGEFCSECGLARFCDPVEQEREMRPTWPSTWMGVARLIAERSYDPRLKVGTVIVPEDNAQILAVGFNGNYRGGPHKHESTEPGKSGFLHSEVNALVKCDYNFPKKKHVYVTHSPCRECSKHLINAQIVKVIYDVEYRDTSGLEIMRSVGITVMSLQEAIEEAILNGGVAR